VHRNRVTTKLGIDYPIIQGPLGGLPCQRLVAAVSNFGGLGSFGAFGLEPAAIRDVIAEIRSLTSRPFAMNLWVSLEDFGARESGETQFNRSLAPLMPFLEAVGARDRRTNRTHRVGSKIRRARCSMPTYPCSADVLPYPLQRDLVRNVSIPAAAANRADLMPLWAGQSASLSTSTDLSAFLRSLVEGIPEIQRTR